MTDNDDFLTWIKSTQNQAQQAFYNGDGAPAWAIWSLNEPVSLLSIAGFTGRTYFGQQDLDAFFTKVFPEHFSDCTSYAVEWKASGVVDDMAYTVGVEHISATLDEVPTDFNLLVTQVFRREDGEWKLAHRHVQNEYQQE